MSNKKQETINHHDNQVEESFDPNEGKNIQYKHDSTHVESDGIVLDSIKGTIKVQLESGQIVLCHLSGKMRLNKIHLLPEDKIRVKLSPYDMTRGIVVRRIK